MDAIKGEATRQHIADRATMHASGLPYAGKGAKALQRLPLRVKLSLRWLAGMWGDYAMGCRRGATAVTARFASVCSGSRWLVRRRTYVLPHPWP